MSVEPTSVQIGNPDGTWTDLSPFARSVELTPESDAEGKRRWDELLATAEPVSFTISGRFLPPPPAYEVTGTYRECQVCHAPLREAPLPDGWKVSLHRAPNPKGSHLKTEEPIFITLHTPDCSGATSS